MDSEQRISQDQRLVVAKVFPGGQIDSTSAQPLSDWERGKRDIGLLQHGYGPELLDIITNELGLVTINKEGILQSKIIVLPSEDGVRGAVMRLLGKIAEALVVRSCNSDPMMNRKWGQVGRRGRNLHTAPDDYLAIGTGLESTKRDYPQKFRPNDPHRDVIWLEKKSLLSEMPMLENGKPIGISAGLQLKASMDGFRYIYRSDVARAKYEVPLVYFDLCNDYYRLTDAIYKEEQDVVIGRDLVRGKDIDPSCHDELYSYWWLVEQIGRAHV